MTRPGVKGLWGYAAGHEDACANGFRGARCGAGILVGDGGVALADQAVGEIAHAEGDLR
jgi:hypothetical protein